MILVGDIGGTKTILAIYYRQEGEWHCQKKQTYASADYAEFDDLLDGFLEQSNISGLVGACLGAAGPVVNGRCQTTNLPWLIDQNRIKTKFGFNHVALLNDLEATAWGVLALKQDELVELNPQAKTAALGNIAVLAAGTGLGEAIINNEDGNYHVIAGEGGHADFGPNSEQEIALLKFLRKKHSDHVSYERLVSGEGLCNIYDFLKVSGEGVETELFNQQLKMHDPAAVIGKAGVLQENELSIKAVNLFCKIYGAEASNVALQCLSYGGVFLAGGIAGKLLPRLQLGYFMEGFLAKGRYREILQGISVKVCLNDECALVGALDYAQRKFIKNLV